ncbi:MAG: hypothetical protein ACI9KE_000083 [Polyangiales bacterium]|jgi:hypothetical protein
MNRLRPNGLGLALRLAIFAAVICAPNAGSAQVESTYSIGHQLWMGYVVIPANTTFEFRTDYNMGGQWPDTVLTLYDWANQDTLEGADGCLHNGQFEWGPSCFQWTNNTNSPTAAFLIARAWRTQTPADTQIHAYDPTLASSGPMAGFFGSTGIVTVGGARVERTIVAGRQHWSTAHMPGNSARHMIMVANDQDIHFLSTVSDIATGLAEADTGDQYIPPGNREIIYGGWGASNVGAVRLLKNDWFNNDADRDGLGTALEASLGTCDGVNDMLATGQTCDGRFAECQVNGGSCSQCDSTEECIAGVCRTQSCAAHLRDTDHDGLRDDVEVYGYGGITTQMARFGADPLHKDVFIEMHTTDRVGSTATVCDGFALGNNARDPRLLGNTNPASNEDFFVRAQEIYDNVALPGSLNPDGSDGITLHFDVGVANPNATDVSWGDWGGGNTCYLTNNYRADCASDLSPARAWLFRWGLDTLGAKAGGNCYYARNTTSHVHEIGHMLGLNHGGPYGTSAEEDNGANNRPSYPSRINYRFQGVVSNGLAFSSGAIEGAVSSRSANENTPFGGTHPDVVGALRQGSPTVDVWPVVPEGDPPPQVNVPGGEFNEDVDWNGNNVIDMNPTIWGRYRDLENGRNARESAGKSHDDWDLNTSIYGSHMDAAIIDDFLVFAYVDYHHELGLPGTVFLKWNRDGVCNIVPTLSGSSWSYGSCIDLGDAVPTGLSADAVSVASTRIPASGGGTAAGMALVYRVGTQLRWQTYRVQAGGGGSVNATLHLGGVFPGYTTNNTQVDATLVEVPQSASNPHGGVLMIYQDSNSVLRQRFLPSGSNTWTGSAQVQTSLSSGTHYSYGDVGAVAYGDKVYLAARHSSVTGIRIYSVPAGAGVNTTWTYETTVPSTQGVGTDIELAVAPAPPGTTAPEFFVMYRDNDNVLLETRAELPNFTNWTDPDSKALETGERSESGVALVYDDRSAGRAGLRAYRNLHRRCDDAPLGVPTACNTTGYAPGRPTDLTCTGGTFCYSASLDFAGAARPSHITQSPFAEGHNPTLYCDYNDNAQMAWAMCQYLTRRDAPTGTSDFVVTPYDSSVRCVMPPRHPEPQSNGTCGPLASTSVDESDRTNNPGAYIPPDEEVICTE